MIKNETFINEVVEQVQRLLGDGFQITVGSRIKNNKVRLSYITIRKEEDDMAPLIYLDGYYEQYQAGMTVEAIVEDIQHVRCCGEVPAVVRSHDLQDYEKMKDRICFKLINREQNEELLKGVPYVPFLSLAAVFYLYLDNSASGQLTAMVTNDWMTVWGTDEKELFRLAEKNTPRWFPAELRNMTDVMKGFLKDMVPMGTECFDMWEIIDMQFEQDPMPLYVLSNRIGVNGAAAMLYPEVLKQMAEEIGNDLVILPSSVHEVLLVPYCEEMNLNEMMELVMGINQTEVPAEDVLADEVYVYRRKVDKIFSGTNGF